MKLNIRAVLFDLGGVILRTDDIQPRTELAQSLGRTYAELDEIVFKNPVAQMAERGQATSEQVWAEIARLLGIDSQQIRITRRRFFAGDKVDGELVGMIAQMRKRYRTGLLSNTWIKELATFLRDDLQIPDIFDVVLSSAALGKAKPGKEIYLSALDALGTQPGETVFVDDNLENIRAASQLGIHTVRFFNTAQAKSDLETFMTLPGVETGMDPNLIS